MTAYFWLIWHFLTLVLIVNLHTKFEGCSFSGSRDMDGVPKLKCHLGHDLLCPLILYFSIVLLVINLHSKFEVCICSRSRDIECVAKF